MRCLATGPHLPAPTAEAGWTLPLQEREIESSAYRASLAPSAVQKSFLKSAGYIFYLHRKTAHILPFEF